jgi:hypothetical protein
MRKLVVALFSSWLLALPASAADEGFEEFLEKPKPEAPEHGPSFGLRTGVAFPFGKVVSGGGKVSDFVGSAIPIQVDAGWRFNRNIYAGGFFQYAFGSLGDPTSRVCASGGLSCSATQLRFGVDLVWTILPRATIIPWLGIGAGYEITKVNGSLQAASADVFTAKGLEFAHLSAGADFRPVSWLRVGPFATVTVGQYSSLEGIDANGNVSTIAIANKGTHGWFQLGLKGTVDL